MYRNDAIYITQNLDDDTLNNKLPGVWHGDDVEILHNGFVKIITYRYSSHRRGFDYVCYVQYIELHFVNSHVTM